MEKGGKFLYKYLIPKKVCTKNTSDYDPNDKTEFLL